MSFAYVAQDEEWISLPEAARRLGVHRTAVNTMILDGRLQGRRDGPYWKVRLDQFEAFAASYVRPPNVPVPVRDAYALPPVAERALGWLARWETASTTELGEVMTDAPGNVRKATDILRSRNLAERDEHGSWALTDRGRALATSRSIGDGDIRS
jgi:excisionase family DNA binding protein